jgi:hypothetical protein
MCHDNCFVVCLLVCFYLISTVPLLAPSIIMNTYSLTSLPHSSGNRNIHIDQLAILILQLLNQFYNFAIQSVKLVLE